MMANEDQFKNLYQTFLTTIESKDKGALIDSIEELSVIFEKYIEKVGIESFTECLTGALIRIFNPISVFLGVRFDDDIPLEQKPYITTDTQAGIFGVFGSSIGVFDIIAQVLDDNPWMAEAWLKNYMSIIGDEIDTGLEEITQMFEEMSKQFEEEDPDDTDEATKKEIQKAMEEIENATITGES